MGQYNINEGLEELKRSLLVMNYDTNKTLSENAELINESTPEEYFDIRIRQILDYPELIKEFTPVIGNTQVKAAKAIKELNELLGLSKKYKESYGESLLSALGGEWFSSGESRIINRGIGLAKKLCNTKPRDKKYDKWCTVVDTKKVKYGF
jgi:hypothetical protein